MKKTAMFLLMLGVAWAQGGDPNYKPKRLNKAIELLAEGQPIYNASAQGGDGYDAGLRLAKTYNDFIIYEMEHGVFDLEALRQFMVGLAAGGPTKSGHRIPAVIVTLPVLGYDETSIRANYWMIHQVLACGVHGIELCHARSPEAVRLFVAACRYPGAPHVDGIEEGWRGSGSEAFAAKIWGVSPAEYRRLADPWPMNPNGELMLSVKIEDKYALANAEKTAAVPGIAFAEWGPGDMGLSLGFPEHHDPPYPPEMAAARERIMAALKKNHVGFLETVRMDDMERLFQEGTNVTHGTSEALTNKGRKLTHRQMPY